MRETLKIFTYLPLLHLGMCFYSIVFCIDYNFNTRILHQVSGGGILIWLGFFFLCIYLKRCTFLKIPCIALCILNLNNILSYFVEFNNVIVYQKACIVFFAILTLVYIIKENTNDRPFIQRQNNRAF